MKAIVLLSGGLDSAVSLALALTKHPVKLALNFDYGQRAAAKESSAARAIARYYGLPFRNIALPWLKEATTTALVNPNRKLPRLNAKELDNRKITLTSAKAVWVPNRNGLFINIAAAFAESMGIDAIVTGFNAEEGETFPDNTKAFVRAINRSLTFSTLNRVRVVSYVGGMTKPEMIEWARELLVPIELTWSCYESGRTPCGKCESCLRRRRAESTEAKRWKNFNCRKIFLDIDGDIRIIHPCPVTRCLRGNTRSHSEHGS